MKKILEYAHELLQSYVTKEDITVDMTAGNGHDTLFLAQISKYVYAFDIQEEAIKNTNKLLQEHNITNVKLIHDSHIFVNKYVNESIGGAVFNLGYLPGSNKKITTNATTTIQAIQNILPLLKARRICVIVVYPGHSEGKIESILVEEFASKLNQQEYQVLKYQFINLRNNPPYIIAIMKK